MLGRRFLLIVAVLMGLTALAASVAPQDPRVRTDGGASAQETATPTPAGPAVDPTRRETMSADDGGQRLVIEQGELLELEVTSSTLDTVVIEDLGQFEPVEEDSPARFNLRGEEPGRYPIELLEAERRVGTLVVREAA